jgi:hypothetical protein
MPTIKLQNGKVILKDGKVSCSCCDTEPCSEFAATYTVTWGDSDWTMLQANAFAGTHVFEKVQPCQWAKLHAQCELWGPDENDPGFNRPPNFAGEFGYVDVVSDLRFTGFEWILVIQGKSLQGGNFGENCGPEDLIFLYQVTPDVEDPTGLYLDADSELLTATVSA